MAPKSSGIAAALAAGLVLATAGSAGAEWLRADEAFGVTARRTGDAVTLSFAIADGYYLYRDEIEAAVDGRSLPVERPPGKAKADPTFGPVEVYFDPVSATVDAPQRDGPMTVRYQGCADGGICYAPVTKTIDLVTMAVAEPGPPVAAAEGARAPAAGRPDDAAVGGGPVEALLSRGGIAAVLGGFVLFGVLLAFTPCVLPMFPILGGLLAREGERLAARRGLALSAIFVLSMSSAFAVLGVAVAWSGRNLQVALQSPAAVGLVAALFVALAASMFGAFELRLPRAWTDRFSRAPSARGSYGAAGALGFTSALVVGPCVTAPLAGALLYIADTGDLALGAGALFALGIGKGIPLMVVGVAGGGALPRAGAWMEGVRWVFAFIFLGTAVWLVSRIVDPPVALLLWGGLAIAAGVFLGGSDAPDAAPRAFARLRRAAGLVTVVHGAVLLVGAAAGATDPLRPLAPLIGASTSRTEPDAGKLAFTAVSDVPDLASAVEAAGAAGRPTLVYFTADWCVTCAVLERTVFADPSVREGLDGVRLVEADITTDTPANRALMSSARVVGPPTMVFLGADGNELPGTRLVGDVGADAMIAAAGRVREGS